MADGWKEFDKKRLALRKKFRRQKWRVRFFWIGFNLLAYILFFTLITGKNFPFAVFASVVSTIISSMYFIKKLNELSRIEAKQDLILMNEAPIGRLKL